MIGVPTPLVEARLMEDVVTGQRANVVALVHKLDADGTKDRTKPSAMVVESGNRDPIGTPSLSHGCAPSEGVLR